MTNKESPAGRDHSFDWLNATQFCGALNDNIFKLLIAFALIKILGRDQSSRIMAVSGAVFVVPFLLFSHAGGVLADHFRKRNITVAIKIMEIGVMLLGVGRHRRRVAVERVPCGQWRVYATVHDRRFGVRRQAHGGDPRRR